MKQKIEVWFEDGSVIYIPIDKYNEKYGNVRTLRAVPIHILEPETTEADLFASDM